MARYIDADTLWEQMKELHEKRAEEANMMDDRVVCVTWHDAVILLKNAQTADVVEVVRCKDCMFWKTETDPIGIECEPGETAHYCDMDGMISRSGDFCSYGERKDNED